MARKPTQQQLFAELEQRYGQAIADAFMAAIQDLRDGADLQRVIAALEARDFEAAIAALHLDADAYAKMLDAIQATYQAGGEGATTYFPAKDRTGAAMIVRFHARNPAAEAWLRDHSATLVTRIVDDQRQAIRQALTAGMIRGVNPRTAALDIVGRVNRVTGKREGGAIGLSAAQETFSGNARSELASPDPADLQKYLGRALRDKRFDRSIAKAIREETTVPVAVQAKALTQYRNRLLKHRGDTIGRVEAMTALQKAKFMAHEQAIADGKVDEDAITKRWRSAHDFRVRHTHAVLDGHKAKFREPFVSPSGARLLHPMDTTMGAGADEIVGCRCTAEYRIDFLASLE